MNILEGLLHSANQPTTAPHVGEAFVLWTYYTALVNVRTICTILINHSADKAIREIIEHFVDEVEEPQIKQVTELMKKEGIPFPAVVIEHPKADEAQVPPGAKFTESEIINLMVVKVEGLMAICHAAMTQALRDDIALLFYRFQGQLLTQGFTMKKTMRTRGWLMIPPAYVGRTSADRPSP